MDRYLGPSKIISGGQTGVDQAALAFADRMGIATGGMLPRDAQTETGPRMDLVDRYHMTLSKRLGYNARTYHNVRNADFTLILCHSLNTPGTVLTLEYVSRLSKPLGMFVEEHTVYSERMLTERLDDFMTCVSGVLRDLTICTLNVAGSRASKWPEGADVTDWVLDGIYNRLCRSVVR